MTTIKNVLEIAGLIIYVLTSIIKWTIGVKVLIFVLEQLAAMPIKND